MRYIILIYLINTFLIGDSFQVNDNSSDFHLRKKRVIDKSEGGDRPVHISYVPYIVNILKNGLANCGGGILKDHIIITAAHCVNRHDVHYSLLSGSHYVTGGIYHNIEHIVLHPGYNPQRISDDLAIVVISPHIRFGNSFNSPIEISYSYVPSGASVIFSGWGCNAYVDRRWVYPQELRSIQVPVISQQECQEKILHNVLITEKEMCTLDGYERKCGGIGDSGAPLVRNGKLIGIYAWSGGYGRYGLSPDIFMKLSFNGYREWVNSTMARFSVPINRGGASSSRSVHSSSRRRSKRVINLHQHGNKRTRITDVPYIVNIIRNGQPHCAGSILAPHFILTAAHCVEKMNGCYKVLSGMHLAFFGMPHIIKNIVVHPGYNTNTSQDDLALLVIHPPIDFKNSYNRPININFDHVPSNVPANFSGWGCNRIEKDKMFYPDDLQSTEFFVISNYECKNTLAHLTTITEREICTLDRSECILAGKGDSGGPLVLDNKLIGVHAWFGGCHKGNLCPSVFMRVSHPAYSRWIMATMRKYRHH